MLLLVKLFCLMAPLLFVFTCMPALFQRNAAFPDLTLYGRIFFLPLHDIINALCAQFRKARKKRNVFLLGVSAATLF